MRGISPEQISAYLDGELTEELRAEMERAIAGDPELAARVANVSRVDGLLRPAFSQTVDEPVPARFGQLLADGVPRPTTRESTFPRIRAALSPATLGTAAACLAAGLIAGGILAPLGSGRSVFELNAAGEMVASTVLDKTLDMARSGQTEGVGGQGAIVRLSFRDSSDRYCRQFEIAASAGLACMKDGVWILDTLAPLPAGAAPGAYAMAGSAIAPEVEAALARVGVVEVLDANGEASAIAAKWNVPVSR